VESVTAIHEKKDMSGFKIATE